MVRVLTLFSVLGVVSDCLLAADRSSRPNIILIVADDLGYGDLGCYGQKRIQTPHLDRMAKEGLRFTQGYAGAAMCRPSRCCLMTGLHTGHARIRANSPGMELKPEDITIPEVLQSAGYATGLFGKWALGDAGKTGLPNQQGFEEWFGFPTQTSGWNCYPEFLVHNTARVVLEKNQGGRTGEFADDLVAEKAIQYLRNRDARPFFLMLAFISPHANQVAGKKGIYAPSTAPYARESWPEHEKNFAAMITRMDAQIGRLLSELKELKLEQETIVLFTSDNGPHNEGGHSEGFFDSAGPLRGLKYQPYEGGLRVPLIVRWPGRIRPGVSDATVAFWDFLPTFAELSGASAPTGIDGRSFLPTLLGKPQRPHQFLYWEFHDKIGFVQVVRMGKWKGIRPGGAPLRLYDLENDRHEDRDVARDEPEVVRQIEEYLKIARTESAVWPVKAGAL